MDTICYFEGKEISKRNGAGGVIFNYNEKRWTTEETNGQMAERRLGLKTKQSSKEERNVGMRCCQG